MIAARRSADREPLMTELADTVASEFAGYFENINAKLTNRSTHCQTSNSGETRTPMGTASATCCCISPATSISTSARIAATGYLRDRDREFTETARPSQDEVVRNFDRAIHLVIDTIRKQSPEA